MNESISVIIPAYNCEAYIAQTLQSLIDQNYPSLEIVVVDDGSKDSTAETVNAFGSVVRYFHQENAGESVARNRGVKESSGEYILFLDSDDLLAPGILGVLAKRIAENTQDSEVIYGIRAFFEKPGDVHVPPSPRPNRSGNIFQEIIQGITLVPGQFVVRKESLAKVGLFREDMQFGEDWEFLLRLAKHLPFTYLNQVFLHKRTHAGMQSLHKDRPDLYELRTSILKGLFPDEYSELAKKYFTRPVVADWHRTFAFSYASVGNKARAREYMWKSLVTWPFQMKPYIWLGSSLRPGRK